MTLPLPLRRRARPIALALVAGAACWSTAALAQSSEPAATAEPAQPTAAAAASATPPATVQLTEAQREAIL
ncbi:MAG: hypothetical protein DI537_57910, partial [Stutzerimonas stutzeri]